MSSNQSTFEKTYSVEGNTSLATHGSMYISGARNLDAGKLLECVKRFHFITRLLTPGELSPGFVLIFRRWYTSSAAGNDPDKKQPPQGAAGLRAAQLSVSGNQPDRRDVHARIRACRYGGQRRQAAALAAAQRVDAVSCIDAGLVG